MLIAFSMQRSREHKGEGAAPEPQELTASSGSDFLSTRKTETFAI